MVGDEKWQRQSNNKLGGTKQNNQMQLMELKEVEEPNAVINEETSKCGDATVLPNVVMVTSMIEPMELC